jgi:hypothetical protein
VLVYEQEKVCNNNEEMDLPYCTPALFTSCGAARARLAKSREERPKDFIFTENQMKRQCVEYEQWQEIGKAKDFQDLLIYLGKLDFASYDINHN